MSQFTVKLNLPSGKVIRISELTNRVQFNIIKYCENRDYEGLSELFEREFFYNNDLDIIDQFYLCVYIRAMFIDPHITFSQDGITNKKYNLDILLDKITNIYDDFTTTASHKNIHITLGLPSTLFFKSIDELYISAIKEVTTGGVTLDVTKLSAAEKEEVISKLPQSLFSHIIEYIERIVQILDTITIQGIDDNYEVRVLSNNTIAFISFLFNTGLNNFYHTLYSFCSSIKNTSSFFFDLTPIETKVIINIHNKHIEDQNKGLANH
jgi:hypothetical protein